MRLMRQETDRETFRFSEVLSALSFALDIVEGQPEGHIVRSCYIGMIIGERLGLTEEQRSTLFYALLLKDAGCSSNASRVMTLFDTDDFEAKRALKTVDWSHIPQAAMYVARVVSPDGPFWKKAQRFLAVGLESQKSARQLVQIRCERGAEITRLMGFPEETVQAIRNLDEHWDGAGHPDGLKRDQIPLLARICGLAQTLEVFYSAYGPVRAEEIARSRRKKWFDPDLVDVFLAEARTSHIWKDLGDPYLTRALSRLEPEDRTLSATPERLDLVARAFAEIIDAKSPFTYRHSEGVARAAVAMGEHMGFDEDALRDQMRAALLHDIGKLGVSNRILDKPARLTTTEFTELKKHTRLTYGILSRVAPFHNIVEVASNHHEKLDGSGYHRGLMAESLDLPSRILTVADMYDALSQDRPYHTGLPKEQAVNILKKQSGTKLCPQSVEALDQLVTKGTV